MGKSRTRKPKPAALGDLVRVTWVDIHHGVTSSPEEMSPKMMTTVGHFLGWHVAEYGEKRVRFLRVSDTRESDGQFYGACAFPQGCVLNVERVET